MLDRGLETKADDFFISHARAKSVLIGGIPRSGTTLVARLIGQRDDTFLWPGETWVLPNVAKLWAGGPPNPECRAQIMQCMRRSLRAALVDMRAWNDANSKLIAVSHVTEAQVDKLVEDLTDLALRAPSRAAALRGGAGILERFQREWSDSPIVAEKTPENIMLFQELSGALDPTWVVSHREPFAVIASLQNRAGADPFAPWDASVETCVGMYLKYAWAVISAARALRPPILVGYDEACSNPERLMERLSARLGKDSQRQVDKRKIRFSRADAWRAFSVSERWLILALTRGVRGCLGYGPQAYSETFLDMVQGAQELPEFASRPLMGVSSEPDSALHWIEQNSAHAILCSSPARRIEVDLYNPPALKIDPQELEVVDCTGRPVFSIALRSGEMSTLGVETAALQASAEQSGVGAVYLLKMRCKHVRTPYASLPGNLDERLLSLMVSDFRPVR